MEIPPLLYCLLVVPFHWISLLSYLSLSLMLWPTVSRPVCLEIKHPSGTYDQIFITVRQLRVCWCGALSLTRGRVCSLQLLLVLASVVIFGSESRGTRDHILLSSLFVASYDSQGYGGGIRPCLHTGRISNWSTLCNLGADCGEITDFYNSVTVSYQSVSTDTRFLSRCVAADVF
jgi:hypothetical protein